MRRWMAGDAAKLLVDGSYRPGEGLPSEAAARPAGLTGSGRWRSQRPGIIVSRAAPFRNDIHRETFAMLLPTLLAAALLVVPSDSLSGTWQVTGDVMGNPLNEVCTLTQTGTVLTGNCRAAEPANAPAWAVTGAVKGDTVFFSHGGDYEGTPLTIAYAGLRASATQLKGNVEVAPFGAGGAFTATPVPAATTSPAAPTKP